MRIAMIGQRGVPATFGGVERHVEELGSRLARRGHEVLVYCRSNYVDGSVTTYRGMRLIGLPTVGTKHLDALVHSGMSTLHAMCRGVDVVHYHALGPGVWAPLPRLIGRAQVVQTIHGMDNQRGKWKPAARALLGAAAWMSGHVPDKTITVSRALEAHYADHYGRRAVHVPNGVEEPSPHPAREITERFGLHAGTYLLFVGRLVPEKAPDVLIEAFRQLSGDTRLVIVGGSSFTDDYERRLARLAADDPRVLLTGYVYGTTLAELYTNAAAFVLPSQLEGLPLTLLEALSYGTPVVASNIAPHMEVLGEAGPGTRFFTAGEADELASALRTVLADLVAERRGAAAGKTRVLATYDWERAADLTEALYRD